MLFSGGFESKDNSLGFNVNSGVILVKEGSGLGDVPGLKLTFVVLKFRFPFSSDSNTVDAPEIF